MKNRTFEISHSSGLEVTKKEATCFTHQLVKDASNPQGKRLYKWQLDTTAGPDAFCCEGLAQGSYMKLCSISENGRSSIQFSFFKNGELWYKAVEFDGDDTNDMHLACLHRLIKKSAKASQPKLVQQQNPVAELMTSLQSKPESKEYATTVGDIFRSIDTNNLVSEILDQKSLVSIGISQSASCPERQRLETLIRAISAYLQHAKRKDVGMLMNGFSLKRLSDGTLCGHLTTEPLPRIANAYVEIHDNPRYSSLKPEDACLQFAKDIVVNLLVGV
jgi:hypothetical protein